MRSFDHDWTHGSYHDGIHDNGHDGMGSGAHDGYGGHNVHDGDDVIHDYDHVLFHVILQPQLPIFGQVVLDLVHRHHLHPSAQYYPVLMNSHLNVCIENNKN